MVISPVGLTTDLVLLQIPAPEPNTLRATFNPTAIASLECSG
jgi:hypothetical protein